MLRITVIDFGDDSLKKLKLEGRIAGTAVIELQRLCDELLTRDQLSRLSLDFADVSFVDGPGINLLRTLGRRDVAVTNCSPFLAELLKGVFPCS